VKLLLLTLLVFGLALFGMSLGVIFGRRQIRSSCGGFSHITGKGEKMTCAGCSSDGKKCSGGLHLRETFD